MNDIPLPEVVARYQAAHDRRDTDSALAAFAVDAHVVDDDRDHRGADEIRRWLETAASEFTYTRTLLAVEATEAGWLVRNRLEGDFPGGVAELRYRFVVTDDLITELVIAP